MQRSAVNLGLRFPSKLFGVRINYCTPVNRIGNPRYRNRACQPPSQHADDARPCASDPSAYIHIYIHTYSEVTYRRHGLSILKNAPPREQDDSAIQPWEIAAASRLRRMSTSKPLMRPSPDWMLTNPSRAILNLKIQRDRLHKYQKRITVITSREHAIAKTLLAQGDRPRALLALRRKKYQETLLAKTDAQLEQLEQLTSSVEFALVQKDVVFGLQEGTRVLTEIQREMGGLEHVEKLMGETAEAVAYQQVCALLFL